MKLVVFGPDRRVGSLQDNQIVDLNGAYAKYAREVDDDPLPALRSAVADLEIREIAVITYPHAVADTFHRDWASRARDELRVPVLHLYSGTSELG